MVKQYKLFLTIMLFLFVLGTPAWMAVAPVCAGPFEGEWVGSWGNSLGERGRDTLWLSMSPDGRLYGTWGKNVRVRGEQTGRRTLRLKGERGNGFFYRVRGYREHGVLYLRYTVIRPNGTSYRGWSELYRR